MWVARVNVIGNGPTDQRAINLESEEMGNASEQFKTSCMNEHSLVVITKIPPGLTTHIHWHIWWYIPIKLIGPQFKKDSRGAMQRRVTWRRQDLVDDVFFTWAEDAHNAWHRLHEIILHLTQYPSLTFLFVISWSAVWFRHCVLLAFTTNSSTGSAHGDW